eukprot:2699176-Pyramimonas_sp.AAC.1
MSAATSMDTAKATDVTISSEKIRQVHLAYQNQDAEQFYDLWRNFPAKRYATDSRDHWPNNFDETTCRQMDKEYQIMDEKFYASSSLPVIRPENVHAFIEHMRPMYNKQ